MRPLLVSRRGVREYRPKGSQLRTVRWRVMESILQSAAVFTISSLCFTVTTFVSPLGVSFSHYFFPPVVVSILSSYHKHADRSHTHSAPRARYLRSQSGVSVSLLAPGSLLFACP